MARNANTICCRLKGEKNRGCRQTVVSVLASVFALLSQVCGAIGYEPDWDKYNKTLRDVVEFSCRNFEKIGLFCKIRHEDSCRLTVDAA